MLHMALHRVAAADDDRPSHAIVHMGHMGALRVVVLCCAGCRADNTRRREFHCMLLSVLGIKHIG